MALKKSTDIAGGSSYFKPEEFKGAVALLVEPKSIARDVPNTFAGITKNRDEVTADVTVFNTQADLEAGNGIEHLGMTITHSGIVNKIGNQIGESVVGRVGKKKFPKSPAPAWVIDPDNTEATVEGTPVDDATFDLVAAYYEAREARLQAALASVPSFG